VAERALAEHGVTMRTVLRLASTEAVTQAVAAGLGVAIVSRAAASDQLALGRIAVLPLADVRIRRAFTKLSLIGRPPSGAAIAFEAMLYERQQPGERSRTSASASSSSSRTPSRRASSR
jgi:DNA-binding transcriptional LysR family regulator